MPFDVWQLVGLLILVLLILCVGRVAEFRSRRGVRPSSIDQRTRAAVGSAASAPPVVLDKQCPSCNALNPTAQVFCGQCGTRLTAAA